jgi:hypothetical protein
MTVLDAMGRVSAVERGVRFALWARGLRAFPTLAQVQQRFRCSRATGHRWINAWADANGIERPYDGQARQPTPSRARAHLGPSA